MDELVEQALYRYFTTALKYMLEQCPEGEARRLERHMGCGEGWVERVLHGDEVLPLEKQAEVAEYFGCSLGKVHYMGQDLRFGIKVDFVPPKDGCGKPGCDCGGHHHH